MSLDNLTSLLTGSVGAIGVLTIWITMLLTGKLHTDAEFQRECDISNGRQDALEREQAAHEQTRRALTEASARGDAAVRATEIVAGALSGHGSGHGSSHGSSAGVPG